MVVWGSPRQLAVAFQLSMDMLHFGALAQIGAEWDGSPVVVAVDRVRLSFYISLVYSFGYLF
jgi:hypothetical protein